jgi:hypothetical protein
MDSQNTHMSDGINPWTDGYLFTDAQFNDALPLDEGQYGASAFDDFTNMDTYGDTSGGFSLRAPTKMEIDPAEFALQPQRNAQNMAFASAAGSRRASSSGSSGQTKRKSTESPLTNPVANMGMNVALQSQQQQRLPSGLNNFQNGQIFEQNFAQPMLNLSLEQGLSRFEFNSAASSPINTRDPTAMTLDSQVHMPAMAQLNRFDQDVPMDTINPEMFAVGSARDLSGAANSRMFQQASPNGMSETPPSGSPDAFDTTQLFNANLAQDVTWPTDFSTQNTSRTGMDPKAAQIAKSAANGKQRRGMGHFAGRSPLHIAPISTKSRVETQINVVMTLEKPPPGIEHLHLPLHTIAKSKLLTKDEYEKSKSLELCTMLVCTSAMHNAEFKEKALKKAAAQNNQEIQRRAELARDSGDEEKNDPKLVPDEDKPANGGEVRICNNCVQRERKRAGRKKTKREEEQQHWERFETERVVVFNSNEYLPFKPCEPQHNPHRDSGLGTESDYYQPPEGALQVTAAMRIACYCRHQSEKEGFQVIFTLKDQNGNVVAQQMSDSILITDDHKTHPTAFPGAAAGDAFYASSGFQANGLPNSQSMVDISTHMPAFTASKSAGSLQALAYGSGFAAQNAAQQMSGSVITNQPSAANTMSSATSRPGSPTVNHFGPNKKRKSSSNFHRKIPSGLTMTPRVDTNQPASSNLSSAISAVSQFSPTSATFPGQMNPYMNMSRNGSMTNFFNSGPPTPSETNAYFGIGQAQVEGSYAASNQAMFSQPSSAVPSRASSPVLHQNRGNMAAYNRQHPIQTSTNSITAGRYPSYTHSSSNSASGDLLLLNNNKQRPTTGVSILHLTPDHGPTTGGNEIAILGEHFVPGMRILFGDQAASSVKFLSPTSLLVHVPASPVPGPVDVTFSPPPTPSSSTGTTPKSSYRYADPTPPPRDEMLIMALKFLATERLGTADQWQAFARTCANKFLQQQVVPAGLGGGQSYPLPQQGYSLSGGGASSSAAASSSTAAAAANAARLPHRLRPNFSLRSVGVSSGDAMTLSMEEDDGRPLTSPTATAAMASNYAAATAAAVAVASRMGLKAC